MKFPLMRSEQGNRARVAARAGQTLLEVADLYRVDLEGPCRGGGAPTEEVRTEKWTEYTYGEGPSCFWCHVQIPSTYSHLLPPATEAEKNGLEEIWEKESTMASRLACMITLKKEHDGMVVFVPDAPPTDVM